MTEDLAHLRRADPPQWVEPMLATLTDERFSHDDWLFERKLDGERCLAFRHGRSQRLLSRSRQRLDRTYPYALRARPGAPVATPLDWDELSSTGMGPQRYTAANLFRRLARRADPWADIARHARPLPHDSRHPA